MALLPHTDVRIHQVEALSMSVTRRLVGSILKGDLRVRGRRVRTNIVRALTEIGLGMREDSNLTMI